MNEIKDVFNLKKKNYLVLLYDLGFIISSTFLTMLFIYIQFSLLKNRVSILDINSILQGYGVIEAHNLLISYVTYVFLFLIIYLLMFSLSRSFFRYLSFSNLFDETLDFQSFWKYYFTNLIFLFVLCLLLYVFIFDYTNIDPAAVQKSYFGFYLSLITLLIFTHFSLFNTINFIKTKDVFLSIKKGFLDMFKIKYFMKPYFFLLVFFILFYFMAKQFPFLSTIFLILTPFVFLWVRNYVRLCYEN